MLTKSPPQAPVLVCVGAAAAGVLGGAWRGFAVAPRRTSSDHGIHVCATGAVGTCAPRRCALGHSGAFFEPAPDFGSPFRPFQSKKSRTGMPIGPRNNGAPHRNSKRPQKQRSCTPDVQMGAKTTKLVQLA
jgi:hypothetical protein